MEKAAQTAHGKKKTEKVLETTARVLTTPDKHEREVVSEAVQEVLNPEQQGAAPTVGNPQQREYLRGAVLRRLKPVDALDANLFLLVNHLPHTRLLNAFFYGLTFIFQGGASLVCHNGNRCSAKPQDHSGRGAGGRPTLAALECVSGTPHQNLLQAEAALHYDHSSDRHRAKAGHLVLSIGTFRGGICGAWLLNNKFRQFWGLRYLVAGFVAFSRIYLGDHYPGDVASGSLLGMLFAMFFHRLLRKKRYFQNSIKVALDNKCLLVAQQYRLTKYSK